MWETLYHTIRSHSQEHNIYYKRRREHFYSHIDILLKIFYETAQNSALSLNTTLVLRHYIAASTNSAASRAFAIIRTAFINLRSYFLEEKIISCTRKETRLQKKKKKKKASRPSSRQVGCMDDYILCLGLPQYIFSWCDNSGLQCPINLCDV